MKSTICIAEDRQICEPSIRLLLVSLRRHCPEATVTLFYPPAKDEFVTWMKTSPKVRLQTSGLKSGYGWNIKPQALMRLLDEGFDEVIWIDSDILVNRSLTRILANLTSDTLAVSDHTLGAEERYDGNAVRARAWGFPVGRVLPSALSSGIVRVTKDHYPLMKRWWDLLQSDTYRNAQKIEEWKERPVHMLGDQDVLTALLTAKEFSHIPIFVLRRGKHIIQFDGVWGYTVAERMRNLLGDGPALIHSGAGKPWSESWQVSPPTLREYVKKSYLDMSPYTLFARQFRRELGCDTEWMEPHYGLSRFLRALGLGQAPLAGLPMAAVLDVARIAKSAVHHPRKSKYFDSAATVERL
jgi:hypothetical protein